MGPTWVLSAPDGPHVGLTNLAIRERLICPEGRVSSLNKCNPIQSAHRKHGIIIFILILSDVYTKNWNLNYFPNCQNGGYFVTPHHNHDRSDVHEKGQGHWSKVKVTKVITQLNGFRTVTPVWIHIWWWNDAQSLMLPRRGALFFFKVVCQISRSHG